MPVKFKETLVISISVFGSCKVIPLQRNVYLHNVLILSRNLQSQAVILPLKINFKKCETKLGLD